jgi:hypothetical protein
METRGGREDSSISMFSNLGGTGTGTKDASEMSSNPNIMASQMVNQSKFHYSLFDETDNAQALMDR